jgi:hypothetical protein
MSERESPPSTTAAEATILRAPVRIVDTEGRTLAELGGDEHGGELVLFDARGKAGIILGHDDRGERMILLRGGISLAMFTSPQGVVCGSLTIDAPGQEEEHEQRRGVMLWSTAQGGHISLSGPGKTALELAADGSGARLQLLSAEGRRLWAQGEKELRTAT